MANLKQYPDGSLGIYSDAEGIDVARFGGPRTPTASAPNFRGGSTLKLPVAGPTDTAGGLLAWLNNLGYDIIVQGASLDVTTASSAACTVSIGQAAGATTLDATFISGQTVATAGQFAKATPVAKKVTNGTYITASTATGASAGLVGNLYVEFIPA